jgi:hypothetical protein
MEPITWWKDAEFNRSFSQMLLPFQDGVDELQPILSTAK